MNKISYLNMKTEPNKTLERSRLLVTVRAKHGLRQATVSLIMTLGRIGIEKRLGFGLISSP
jgi:hypothetical protein